MRFFSVLKTLVDTLNKCKFECCYNVDAEASHMLPYYTVCANEPAKQSIVFGPVCPCVSVFPCNNKQVCHIVAVAVDQRSVGFAACVDIG